MLYQHGLKVPIFGVLGFSFVAYAHLLVSLIAATAIGTLIGRLLVNVPPQLIKPIFKAVVTNRMAG